MKVLFQKEIYRLFTSSVGCITLLLWTLSLVLLLWFFGGNYNLVQSGYADLAPLFHLLPILLLFLSPAITMGLIAEERRSGTLELLQFRPIKPHHIIGAKYLAAIFVWIVGVALTSITTLSVAYFSTQTLDIGLLFTSYLGVLFVVFIFTSVGLWVSAFVRHQVIVYLLTLFLNFSFFYGGDLLASLTHQGSLHNSLLDASLNAHYQTLLKGLIDAQDIFYFLFFIIVFLWLSIYSIRYTYSHSFKRSSIIGVVVLLVVFFLNSFFLIRYDVSQDQRFSLSDYTRQLMQEIKSPLQVRLYLSGTLNPSFDRLRKATLDLLDEVAQYASCDITLKQLDLSIDNKAQQKKQKEQLEKKGIKGLTVYEKNADGTRTRRVIYPWMEVLTPSDTLTISLLQRNINQNSLQMIHTSIAQLEYQWSSAVRLLTQKESPRIAYIEGHGELTEAETYESTRLLSRYYAVDRGRVPLDYRELMPYKVLVIAGAKQPYTPAEKCVLDNYVMHGGSLLVLLDGVCYNEDEFIATGEAVTFKNPAQLDDLLFTYGVRVNPNLVQDMNCTPIRLKQRGKQEGFSSMSTLPWYFAPLLQPSASSILTHSLSPLKSEYVSTLSLVGDHNLRYTPLLTTSSSTHLLQVPEKLSLRYVELPAERSYFKENKQLTAVLVEGCFPSLFRHQLLPNKVYVEKRKQSILTRILVAGTSSLIRNDWQGVGAQTRPISLGYDPIVKQQLGNGSFIVNSVNYLAGNTTLLQLRSTSQKLRLIDRAKLIYLSSWRWLNLLLPLLLLFLLAFAFLMLRRRTYV